MTWSHRSTMRLTTRLTMGILASALLTGSALAEPLRDVRDASARGPTASDAAELSAQLARVDAEARRAEVAARDGRARVSALLAVARAARAKIETMSGVDRVEAEVGLAYLQAHIASVEATARADERMAAEFRAALARLRGGPLPPTVRPDAAVCDPAFRIDELGRKHWKEECL